MSTTIIFMSNGIRVDSEYNFTSYFPSCLDNINISDPQEYICDTAALEFADLFDETDRSDVHLNSASFVETDFRTMQYTKTGYVELRGNITFGYDDKGKFNLVTGLNIAHGGLRESRRDKIMEDVHKKAEEAMENTLNKNGIQFF